MSSGKRLMSIVVCLAAVAVIGPCRFGSYSVCTRCGEGRGTSSRQVPILSINYWTTHRADQTELSRAVSATQLIGPHDHEWLFVHGNTFPIFSCALGRGGAVANIARSAQVAAFVKNVTEYDSPAAARRWLGQILDPTSSRYFFFALRECQFPESGFSDEAGYKEWAASGLQELAERMAERSTED
jgi:hypothetical protein